MSGTSDLKWGTDNLLGEDKGYVENVSISMSGDNSSVKNKDGKVKAMAFYGQKKELSATLVIKGTLPKIGDTITSGSGSGGGSGSGTYTITSVEESGSNKDFVKANIKAVMYGDGTITPDTDPGGSS